MQSEIKTRLKCCVCDSDKVTFKTKNVQVGKGEFAIDVNVEVEYCLDCGESFYTEESTNKMNSAFTEYREKIAKIQTEYTVIKHENNTLKIKIAELEEINKCIKKALKRTNICINRCNDSIGCIKEFYTTTHYKMFLDVLTDLKERVELNEQILKDNE